MNAIVLNGQPQLFDIFEKFSLPVLADAYTAMGRVIHVILKIMKAMFQDLIPSGTDRISLDVFFFNESTGLFSGSTFNFDVLLNSFSNISALKNVIQSSILTEASTRSYSGFSALDIIWNMPSTAPVGLVVAPQAAITDAPADAVTNYNIVTTLLGTLTSAVNTANTKQNDIATKLNTLLSELRTLGLITP